jgi:hypothetical protein
MTRPAGRRVRVASMKHHVASFMSGLGVNCECCLLLIAPIPGTLENAIAAADQHVAKHRATPDGRLPLYPWSDGTRRPADPSHGQHSHRLQWYVEQVYEPHGLIDRAVALTNAADRLDVVRYTDTWLSELPDEAWSARPGDPL